MFNIVIRVAIIAVALVVAIMLVPDAEFTGDWWQLVLLAIVFGLVNAYLRPIVKLLSLPLNLVFFGLIGFVINTGLLLLVALIGQQLSLDLTFASWPGAAFDVDVAISAFLTSLVVSAVSTALALVKAITPGV